jgi:hypothetical protein
MNKIEVWHSGGTDINAEHPPGADSSPSPCSEFLDWSAQAGYSSCTSDIQLAIWEGWKAGQEHARKTNGDESKVGPWLLSYYTEWHGEMRTWKKRRKDSFYRDIATLTLFCKDYHFPNAASQLSPESEAKGD